jgi:pre-mRNA-processing factor 6
VRHIPNSVKLWLYAAEIEEDPDKKKVVLRRALEFIPNSVKLWRTAIELESAVDARIMLARAVECVPTSVDMWLALAKLESYDNARKVLNQAREAIPTEPSIWITAAKLEEAHGNGMVVDRIIEKTLASLTQYQVVINRDFWLREAEACETAGAVLTCASIVKNVLHIGVDEEDRKRTWMDDAEACLQRVPPMLETARAIYQHAINVYPSKKSIWMAAAMMEKEHGSVETLAKILTEAVRKCPTAEVLWLMAAKERWLAGDVSGARSTLVEAFGANPNSEQIWLAAIKLEWENDEIQRARILLAKARDRAPTERVWMKSALLEREVGDVHAELTLLDEAIGMYPSFAKYYMMAGQACTELLHELVRAKTYYQRGIESCPDCVTLWILMAQLEERSKGIIRARSVMETARLKFPRNEELWLHSVRFERKIPGNERLADALMARAMQECGDSGLLWAEEVSTCSKQQQKSKSIDALKKCDNDPLVIVAVANLFARDRKYDKARKWLERAVTLAPRLGDAWVHWYAFELRQADIGKGSVPQYEEILAKCVAAEPNRGELWCGMAKRTEHRRKGVGFVLKKAAEELLNAIATDTDSRRGVSAME